MVRHCVAFTFSISIENKPLDRKFSADFKLCKPREFWSVAGSKGWPSRSQLNRLGNKFVVESMILQSSRCRTADWPAIVKDGQLERFHPLDWTTAGRERKVEDMVTVTRSSRSFLTRQSIWIVQFTINSRKNKSHSAPASCFHGDAFHRWPSCALSNDYARLGNNRRYDDNSREDRAKQAQNLFQQFSFFTEADPVKAISWMLGWSKVAAPTTSPAPVAILITPGGNPAWKRIITSIVWLYMHH